MYVSHALSWRKIAILNNFNFVLTNFIAKIVMTAKQIENE